MSRSSDRRLPVALIACCCCFIVSPPARADVITGIASQTSSMFASPWFQGLDVNTVRLDLPWNAGLTSGPWNSWLQQAGAAGDHVLIAIDHAEDADCPTTRCTLVDSTSYEQGLAALLNEYPFITQIEPWNEPNDSTEPTADNPAAAAAYYGDALSVCPTCTIIAGDFLDGPSLGDYMRAYISALQTTPAVWGLHDYYDANYFESAGVTTMLSATSGPLWLTETGGIVENGDLPYDEQRAAQSVDWLYGLAAEYPQIARIYFYGWLQNTMTDGFDSGLLGNDGTPRPAYWAIRAHTNPTTDPPPTPALETSQSPVPSTKPPSPTTQTISPTTVLAAYPRFSGRTAQLLSDGTLRLALACVAAIKSQVCTGTVATKVEGLIATQRFSLRADQVAQIAIKLARRTLHALTDERAAHAALAFCQKNDCTAAQRIVVSKPGR